MTPDEIRDIASRAGMTVKELRSAAMPYVMEADPTSQLYRLAWHVWYDGEEAEQQERKAHLLAQGWVYYPRSENDKPITCPYCGAAAHLTGGKRQHWTCRKCDALQVGYEPEGGDGFWMRWQTATK